MSYKLNRGFTLIELLVVIAIIGILSSVVLASLNTARGKGADAAVKANLDQTRTQSELFYDNVGSYSGVCADETMKIALKAASQAGAGNDTSSLCNNSPSATNAAWAASSPMKSKNLVNGSSGTDYWCVDSVGNSKLETDPFPNATTYVCAP